MKELQVYDLFVLTIMGDQPDLSYRALHDAVNDHIRALDVSADYASPTTNKSAVENSLRRLHAAGLIDAPKPSATIQRFEVRELVKHVGSDWRRYPYFIPIKDEGGLDFENMKERKNV